MPVAHGKVAEDMTVLGNEHRQDREILFPFRLDDAIMTTDMPWAQTLRDTCHIADWARCLDNKESYWQASRPHHLRSHQTTLRPTLHANQEKTPPVWLDRCGGRGLPSLLGRPADPPLNHTSAFLKERCSRVYIHKET